MFVHGWGKICVKFQKLIRQNMTASIKYWKWEILTGTDRIAGSNSKPMWPDMASGIKWDGDSTNGYMDFEMNVSGEISRCSDLEIIFFIDFCHFIFYIYELFIYLFFLAVHIQKYVFDFKIKWRASFAVFSHYIVGIFLLMNVRKVVKLALNGSSTL